MLSNKCKYALRAILFLAIESTPSKKIRISELAGELKMPAPYLAKILQSLVPQHIISSTKGPNGGFYMTEKNLQIPLINIIDTIEGLAYFEKCGLGLDACSDTHPCPIHEEFKISREPLKSLFTNNNVKDLANDITTNDLFLVR